MSALTCDICGGNLTMNESGEFAVCESCGMKHDKRRVQAKVQEITGVVEVTKGEAEKERIINNIKVHIANGNIVNATRLLEQLVFDYPNEKCIQELQTMLQSENNKIKMKDFVKCLEKETFVSVSDMMTYVANNTEAYKFVDLYCDIMNNRRKDGLLPTYEDIREWIEIPTKNLSNFNLEKVQEYITHWYMESLENNSISYIWKGASAKYWCELLGVPYDIHKQRFVIEEAKNTYLASFVVSGEQNAKEFVDKYGYYKIGYAEIKPLFCLGRLNLYFDEDFLLQQCSSSINMIIAGMEVKKQENQATIWKTKGQCSWCGGEFKGVFKKVCSKCGKPKDY